jgi:hypothetical protein
MALPHAEKLLKEAHEGKVLSTDQRRHVVGWLMATQPEVTTREMADAFNAAERTIRDDKAWVRKQASEVIKSEDIGLVIADIRMTYERFVERIEKSLKKCTEGTTVYLNHLKLLMEMELKVVEALQSLGYYPKNLGNMTTTKYEYKAHVARDGNVEVRPVDMLDHFIEADENPDDSKKREAFDAEFTDVKLLPASTESTDGTENPDPGIQTK